MLNIPWSRDTCSRGWDGFSWKATHLWRQGGMHVRETGPRHLGRRFRTVPLGFSNRNGHVTLNFILNFILLWMSFVWSSKVKKYTERLSYWLDTAIYTFFSPVLSLLLLSLFNNRTRWNGVFIKEEIGNLKWAKSFAKCCDERLMWLLILYHFMILSNMDYNSSRE